MSRLIRYFFQGLIVFVPLAVTAYLIYAAFVTVDRWLRLPVPGLGVVVIVVAMVLLGVATNLLITAPLIRLLERMVSRLPFAKILYGAIRDLLSAVVGDERRFEHPVLVQVADHIEVVGFITGETLEQLGIDDRVAVYLPQSYNFAGQTIIVHRDRITRLEASGADAMRFIVSAGIAQSPDREEDEA